MHIQIEEQTINSRDFPHQRSSTGRYYVVSQPALMFKDGQKYPDKFPLDLIFTENKAEADNCKALPPGRYHLSEDAFYIDRNQRPQCNFSRLTPVPVAARAAS
jgi:hypothetical protein